MRSIEWRQPTDPANVHFNEHFSLFHCFHYFFHFLREHTVPRNGPPSSQFDANNKSANKLPHKILRCIIFIIHFRQMRLCVPNHPLLLLLLTVGLIQSNADDNFIMLMVKENEAACFINCNSKLFSHSMNPYFVWSIRILSVWPNSVQSLWFLCVGGIDACVH